MNRQRLADIRGAVQCPRERCLGTYLSWKSTHRRSKRSDYGLGSVTMLQWSFNVRATFSRQGMYFRFQCDEVCYSTFSQKKSANKCRWQRRRDRPRPPRPLRVRRWQAAIALPSAPAQSHDPPHSSSNRIFAPRCQPHGTPLTCCTDMLPHTPTPTNTPLGDGTSLNWMPLRAASA